MSERTEIYDLGEIGAESTTEPRHETSAPGPRVVRRTSRRGGEAGFNVAGSLSLFVPGLSQIVRGDVAGGFFFLSCFGFVAALGWAVVATLPRLSETLQVLGQSRAVPMWVLGALYAIAGVLYLVCVMSANPQWFVATSLRPVHSAVAGTASMIFPGWGQILNGDRVRAIVFLTCMWFIGAAWLLVSPPVQTLMVELGLYLPAPIQALTSPIVRWTLPAVVWSLAIYDAASRAERHRF
jgi:hypothetical protein